jgi:4-carboxymuconolactone decarboxylase
MSRLEELDPQNLTAAQSQLISAIESGPRGNRPGRSLGFVGPFGVWLRAPELGLAAQNLGAAVRYNSALVETVKEIAICAVGAHFHAKFEFAVHGPMAIRAGVDKAVIESIRTHTAPNFSDTAEALGFEVTCALLCEHRLSDDLYARARATFSERELVELVTTVGYYSNICLTLNAFEVPLTEQMIDPFPDR